MSRWPCLIMVIACWAIGCSRPQAPSGSDARDRLERIPGIPAHAALLVRADTAAARGGLRILATVDGSESRRQWLILLQTVGHGTISDNTTPLPDAVLYTSLGHRFVFPRKREPVTVQVLGPVDGKTGIMSTATPAPITLWLESALLELGFAGTAAVNFDRMRRNGSGVKGSLSFRHQPFPEAEILANRARLAALGLTLTEEEVRSLICCGPAFQGFLGLVQDTPPLERILSSVMPTLGVGTILGVLWNGSAQLDLHFDSMAVTTMNPTAWGMPVDRRLFRLPLDLGVGGEKVLRIDLVVTDPLPPLRQVAGIVGAMVIPADTSGQVLSLRVLAP